MPSYTTVETVGQADSGIGSWVEAGDYETIVIRQGASLPGTPPAKIYATAVQPSGRARLGLLPGWTLRDQDKGRGLQYATWPDTPTPLAVLTSGGSYTVTPGSRVFVGMQGAMQLTRTRTPPR